MQPLLTMLKSLVRAARDVPYLLADALFLARDKRRVLRTRTILRVPHLSHRRGGKRA